MQSNLNFLFYLKKPKGYVSGPVPIYHRLTVNGQRAEMPISRECQPERWNSDAGLARGTTEEVKALNAFISILQGKIHHYHNQLLATGEPITASVFK